MSVSTSASESPAISAAALSASTGRGVERRAVLDSIALSIAAGRVTAIVGPNGAGKSTLLRALAGIAAPDFEVSGELRVNGRALASLGARARARAVAWLGQDGAGAEGLRAGDVVMLGRLPHRGWLAPPSSADHAAVRRAMAATESWALRDRLLGRLSGGERQRVLLARALAVEAGVLLLDEPLTGLDPPHQADWLALVHALAARGTAVVCALHEPTLALAAHELVVIAAGRVLHHGATGSADTHAALEAVFDQRLRVHALDGRWVALPV